MPGLMTIKRSAFDAVDGLTKSCRATKTTTCSCVCTNDSVLLYLSDHATLAHVRRQLQFLAPHAHQPVVFLAQTLANYMTTDTIDTASK